MKYIKKYNETIDINFDDIDEEEYNEHHIIEDLLNGEKIKVPEHKWNDFVNIFKNNGYDIRWANNSKVSVNQYEMLLREEYEDFIGEEPYDDNELRDTLSEELEINFILISLYKNVDNNIIRITYEFTNRNEQINNVVLFENINIDFDDWDEEEYNTIEQPKENQTREYYEQFIGKKVILKDNSEYIYQNPLDDNGYKIKGTITKLYKDCYDHYNDEYHIFWIQWLDKETGKDDCYRVKDIEIVD